MRFAQAGRFFPLAVFALACAACQSAPPPPAATPAAPVKPIVACERTCSTNYDSCMDGAQASLAPGAHSSPAMPPQDPAAICRDQLKVCLRQCLN
jgi:hypothetical protein